MGMKKQKVLMVLVLGAACSAGCGIKNSSVKSASVSFEMRTFSKTLDGCPSEKGAACVTVELEYPEVTAASSPEIKDKFNQVITNAILMPLMKGGQSLSKEELAQQVIVAYQDVQQKTSGHTAVWSLRRTARVVNQTGGLFIVSYQEETSTGGAHPNSSRLYLNFWSASAEQIQLQDIVIAGSEEKLLKSAESRFRQIKNLAPTASLTQAGYWFENDKFRLTQTFGLAKEGLTFYYGNYEIAPYAMGATSLTIPYAELQGVLREDLGLK